jgi:hypothetical protein
MRRSRLPEIKSYPLRMSGKCPVCDQTFFFEDHAGPGDCVTDCSRCGELLLIENNLIYPFHKKLHSEDSRWPEDGIGTGYVTLQGFPAKT